MPRRKSGGDAATQSIGMEPSPADDGLTPSATGSEAASGSAAASGSEAASSSEGTSASTAAARSPAEAAPPTFIRRVSRKIQNRAARIASWRWRHAGGDSQDPIIVIGGCPRSGTTLLRRLLDEHPSICCGPESSALLPGRPNPDELAFSYDVPRDEVVALLADSDSQAAFVAGFFGRVAQARGKRRWAEKTPLNIAHLGWVLSHFPRARVIHVVRDGRDVVCSLRRHPVRRFIDGGWKSVPQHRSVVSCTRQWLSLTGKGLDWRTDARYLEVRYEDLVEAPEATMRRVMAFLEEPFDPEWLRTRLAVDDASKRSTTAATKRPNAAGAITSGSIGRWMRDLSVPEIDQVRRLATDRLLELDYVTERDWR
jgi:protein-tyrosine sulfotransferase